MKAQGVGHYIAHFAGPSIFVAPLLFPLEIMGLFIRIFSHSLRLFVNMGLEHIIGGVFFGIFPLIVPVPMMFMGLLVCCIQCYVFIVLTTVYLGGAVAVAEHH
jgi:F-type H+-transporting ATPase subunit a